MFTRDGTCVRIPPSAGNPDASVSGRLADMILASSQEEACWARDKVLSLCQELGIVVNLESRLLLHLRPLFTWESG